MREFDTKEAVFKAGAGSVWGKTYDRRAFVSKGMLKEKFMGRIQRKVEIVVKSTKVDEVIDSLVKSHPYKKPLYGLTRVYTEADFMKKGKCKFKEKW